MPSSPSYSHRLDDGIHALESMSGVWIDRRTLQETFGVSKWTAWRILKRCGAQEGPGNTRVCPRVELIEQLKKLREDGRFAPEIARRARVEKYLEGMARYASQRHQKIARDEAAVGLLSSRFSNLPAGIDLQRGELRISFTGTAEFLQKFGAIVFALNNDFEQIRDFLDQE